MTKVNVPMSYSFFYLLGKLFAIGIILLSILALGWGFKVVLHGLFGWF